MELNLFGIGSIMLDKINSPSLSKLIAAFCFIYMGCIGIGLFSPKPFQTMPITLWEGECTLKDMTYESCYHVSSLATDVIKFEVQFTLNQSMVSEWKSNELMQYTLRIQGYNDDKCQKSDEFIDESALSARLENCDNEFYECDPIFLAQYSYFDNSYFAVKLDSMSTPNSDSPLFTKIDLVVTSREFYFYTMVIIRLIFAVTSAVWGLYYVKRLLQFSFTDIGIIQKKLLYLLILLFFFNEPFYVLFGLSNNRAINVFNTLIQSSFLAMLLHFWTYLIDTISQDEVIRLNPIKFGCPKITLALLLWIFLTISMISVRFKEANNPLIYWNLATKDSSMIIFSAVLLLLLVIYCLYLVIITYISCSSIKRMKENYKYLLCTTYGVIAIWVGCLGLVGIENYVSSSTTILKILSLKGLFNLYIYLLAYLLAPTSYKTSRFRSPHDQIISDLYEQELPEMPTMRDDDEAHHDKNSHYQIGDAVESENSKSKN